MAKSKKPAPKGGKKVAAPKKVAKRAPAKKQLTASQIDQFNADKMRADSAIAAGSQSIGDAMRAFETTGYIVPASISGLTDTKPLHPTVEEQWEQSLVDAKAQGKVWSELAAATMAGVDLGASAAPTKKSMWARFRSAVTGLFVSKKFAAANPDTTVREKVE